jgi:hypothetical protein
VQNFEVCVIRRNFTEGLAEVKVDTVHLHLWADSRCDTV